MILNANYIDTGGGTVTPEPESGIKPPENISELVDEAGSYQLDYFNRYYKGTTVAEDFTFALCCILGPIFSWNGRSWEFDSPYREKIDEANEYLATYIDAINQTPFFDYLGIHLMDIHIETTEASLFQFSLTFDTLPIFDGETIGDYYGNGYGDYTSGQRVAVERLLSNAGLQDYEKRELLQDNAWIYTFLIIAELRFTMEGS